MLRNTDTVPRAVLSILSLFHKDGRLTKEKIKESNDQEMVLLEPNFHTKYVVGQNEKQLTKALIAHLVSSMMCRS